MDREITEKLPVNLILVNYGRQTSMAVECLNSVFKFHPELEEKTIVVDNASKDNGAKRLQEKFPGIRMISSKTNAGLSKAINWGVFNSNQRYILYLNNDILVQDANTIPMMVRYMSKNEETALLGPQLVNRDGSLQLSCFKFPTPAYITYRRTGLGKFPFAKKTIDRIMMKSVDKSTTQEVDWILGAAMMFKRDAFLDIGMMDERYFLYFEDVDLCRRFWEGGYKVIYFPKAKMIHYHLRESDAAVGVFKALRHKLTRKHILSGLRYFMKYSSSNMDIRTSTLQAMRNRKHELEKIKHQKL